MEGASGFAAGPSDCMPIVAVRRRSKGPCPAEPHGPGTRPRIASFPVIGVAGHDGDGPIELLGQEDTSDLMGKGHATEG
mgnify:CR=1 FL=1